MLSLIAVKQPLYLSQKKQKKRTLVRFLYFRRIVSPESGIETLLRYIEGKEKPRVVANCLRSPSAYHPYQKIEYMSYLGHYRRTKKPPTAPFRLQT